jgi:cytochrome c553
MNLLLATLLVVPQQRPPAPPLPDADASIARGLTLRLRSGSLEDVRGTRLAALSVPAGSAPSPFLPPGPFQADWEGFVSVDLGTDVQFSAQGRGSVRLLVNDKPALEAKGEDLSGVDGPFVRLRKGRNKLALHYESPAEGDAWIRLEWTSPDFPKEPVPPLELHHDRQAKDLRAARRLREGRELVALHRCIKCHLDPAKGFPELEMDAPSLAEAGTRLNPAWMEAWILDPRAVRPEATMPRLHGLGPQDAADLAAYLAGLGTPAPDGPPPRAEQVAAGGTLFAEMRCVGCHTLPDREPAADRIPMRHLKAKWRPAALRAFLKAPEAHYAWIEMPNFRLSDGEAAALAAFLLSQPGTPVPSAGLRGDPGRGHALAESKGCMNCHALPGTNRFKTAPFREIPAGAWNGGCVAGKPPAPDFGFSDDRRQALQAFAATDLAALGRDAAPEFLDRQIRTLRCLSCHKRDDRADAWTEVAGEAKHLLPKKKPQDDDDEFAEIAEAEPWFPSLTWTGERLRPEWAVAFLKGDPAIERPRPYLKNLRMPAFPSRAEGLVHGMTQEHGCLPASPVPPKPDAELAEIGRRLSGPGGGLDCLSCHAIAGRAATKVFEAPAPNFRLTRDRLRRDFFERWLREPLRLEPGTKMPQFIKDGRTQLTDILDGDAARQTEAIWQYLLEGPAIRPPEE